MDKMIVRIVMVLLIVLYQVPSAYAQNKKFELSGQLLIYNTFLAENENEQEITWADVDELKVLLRANENIRKLELNSSGGDLEAAMYMADIVIDYELDTNVNGTCDSACTLIFLGGEKRTIERGSWLGFHQSYWDATYIKDYYDYHAESEGWKTPFEFASWMYEDTQQEILRKLQYFVERHVDAAFAIKTMKATSDNMWYPRRKELIRAGVIVE